MTDRFRGYDVRAQARHWDPVTAGVVLGRLAPPPSLRFFTPDEEAAATALFDLLLDQRDDPRVSVTALVDARLAEMQTDGWRYGDMPEDPEAWRQTLASLDLDAFRRCGDTFAGCRRLDQTALVQGVQDLDGQDWHGLPAARVWSLWTRYACTAFYADPRVWNEIGFGGPAYPRGYKNLGVDHREPFEVADQHAADPVRGES